MKKSNLPQIEAAPFAAKASAARRKGIADSWRLKTSIAALPMA